jgi:uncharacterized membrane protein YedE/YeeE
MTIDWNNFTPWTSLAGGILIGLAAALLLLMSGRIAGVSGIVGGLIPPRSGERSWRIAFLAGLIAAPLVYALFMPLPPMRVVAGTGGLIAAGLLVGLGTRYASGCTSGHGVCGFARRSPRSMAATAAFMAAGFVTVFILRHIL